MGIRFATSILMLVISVSYIVTTQGAGNEDNRKFSTTSRLDKGSMKRLMDLRTHENAGSSSSREIRKKGRSDEGSSSARDWVTGRTEAGFVPASERGGIPKRISRTWTNKEQKGLIRLAYTISILEGPNSNYGFNWKRIGEYWNRHWNDKAPETLKKKLLRMLEKMRVAGEKFNVQHGWATWPENFDNYLLMMYFNTEVGDKARHGERINAEWEKMGLPIYEGMTPKHLLDRADAMLESVNKFDISDPRGRTAMLRNLEQVGWTPEQDEYFLHLLQKHPKNETHRLQNIYNEALGKYEGLQFIGRKKFYEHLRQFRDDIPHLLEAHETSAMRASAGPVGGSSHDTIHSQYHSFMDDYNSTSLNLGTHSHYGGMAGTSSHPVPSQDQPDLELRLDSLHVGEQSPDTELKLGYSQHRGGHH